MAAKKTSTPKRGASRYQAPQRKPVPGWLWMVSGLVIGGLLMFLMQLEPGRDEIKRVKPEDVAAAKKKEAAAAKAGQDQAKPKYDFYTLLPESEVIVPPDAMQQPATPPGKPPTPEEAAKLDAARAEALLNGQTPPPTPPAVVPGSLPSTPATPAATPAATVATAATKAPLATQYFLQAGSFRKQADADKVRAQIILLGQSVQVESGTVRDETWYRVLVGPFASKDQLGAAQKQLAASGYSNLLLQQRQNR
jgi:cell division protein FtsN